MISNISFGISDIILDSSGFMDLTYPSIKNRLLNRTCDKQYKSSAESGLPAPTSNDDLLALQLSDDMLYKL